MEILRVAQQQFCLYPDWLDNYRTGVWDKKGGYAKPRASPSGLIRKVCCNPSKRSTNQSFPESKQNQCKELRFKMVIEINLGERQPT